MTSIPILQVWLPKEATRIHGLILSLDSIKSISKQIAKDLLTFYNGDKPGFTPGLLPEPPYFCTL